MRTHGTVQENLYAYLHAELSAPDRLAIEKHLRSCARCGKELESMRETMDLVGLKPPKPSQHRNELYWQLFAEKVERRIQSESTEVESPALVGRLVDFLTENQKPFSFGFISALSLGLLALAVWGLWIKAPTPDQIASNSSSVGAIGSHANVEETAMEVRAENYLEQSKTLLIGIMNTDTKSIVGSKSSLDRQRAISKTLNRNRVFKESRSSRVVWNETAFSSK
jgi:hypothetical protein